MRGLLSCLVLVPASLPAAEMPLGKEFTNTIGMRLVRIEAGEFVMGSGKQRPTSEAEWKVRDWDESPAHQVRISRAFYMGVFEVTNAQYERFDPAHQKLRGVANSSARDDDPVTMVTWKNAADFCQWLSAQDGLPYRLPTEAEWEYACRAGTTTRYYTGDALSVEQANIAGGKRDRIRAVGSYKPNPWGLHDMHGNVEEWCLDWYGPYSSDDKTDPIGRADGFVRVSRGGSYDIPSWQDDNAHYCRSANRSGSLPEDANRCTGFRVVLGELAKSKPLPVPPAPRYAQDVKQTLAPKAGPDPNEPFFDVPDMNDHAPVLLTHEGRVYHFASQSMRSWNETTNVLRTSDDNGATWSKPRIIARREGPDQLSQACSGFVKKDGTIHVAIDCGGHHGEKLLIGRELGKAWTVAAGDLREAVGGTYAIHPAIAPANGGVIVAFMRGPDPMPRLVSKDRGESWSVRDTPFGGIGVGQKVAALRLDSGALLLCANDTHKPPITGKRGTLVALSNDDGATWSHVRHLPGVGGYMSAAQAVNGVIYVFGTRMSCIAFNEAWLKEGQPIKR